MQYDKRNKKNNDNNGLLIGLGLLGITAIGAMVWTRSSSSTTGASSGSSPNSTSEASSGTSSTATAEPSSTSGTTSGSSSKSGSKSGSTSPAKSLFEVAAALRSELLTVTGCSVAWRLGEASRTALLTHQNDFFLPAIADARAKGLSTTDEITSHLASVLVPGCQWPPKTIADIDIQAAINGELGMVQTQVWTIAQALGSVQLYLAIRQAVVSLRNRG